MMDAVRLLTLSLVMSLTSCANIPADEGHLEKLMSVIERMVYYYKSANRQLNIDGLFGLRVIEGQLGQLLEEYAAGNIQQTPDSVLRRIRLMKIEATKVAQDAVSYVAKDDPAYYEKLHFVVSRPWTLSKPHSQLNHTLRWTQDVYQKNTAHLSESSSDKCMSELTGVLHETTTKCQISAFCADLMTSKGLTGYGITHQILWTMLAEQAGCVNDMTKAFMEMGYPSLEQYQLEFCTNNFYEMIQVIHGELKSEILPRFQDLFLEQQFVCPNLGYHEFLSTEFLDKILTWQHTTGCFGLMPRPNDVSNPEIRDKLKDDYNYVDESEQIQNQNKLQPNVNEMQQVPKHNKAKINDIDSGSVVMQKGNTLVMENSNAGDNLKFDGKVNKGGSLPNSAVNVSDRDRQVHEYRFQSRRLLAEKELKDGCLAHKTAVAAGALMMYLRYILDPGPSNLSKNSKIIREKLLHNEEQFQGKRKATGLQLNQAKKSDPADNIHAILPPGRNSAETDDYYSQEKGRDGENYKDDEYEKYPNDNIDKLHHKMVQIDNAPKDSKDKKGKEGHGVKSTKDKEEDDNYEDDDNYKDDKNDDDYKVDDKQDIIKKDSVKKQEKQTDDGDYPYYDNDHHDDHDDYKEEVKDKQQVKVVDKKDQEVRDQDSESSYTYKDTKVNNVSHRNMFLLVLVTSFVLLLLMYRFIRTRRIHIKYKIRSMLHI